MRIKSVSKRQPLKQKYAIEKKAKAYKKKLSKIATKSKGDNVFSSKVSLKKRKVGKLKIPNSFPFKGDLLSRIEMVRQRKREEQLERRKKTQQPELQPADLAAQMSLREEKGYESLLESVNMRQSNHAITTKLPGTKTQIRVCAEPINPNRNISMTQSSHSSSPSFKSEDSNSQRRMNNSTTRTNKKTKALYDVVRVSDVVVQVLDARDPLATRSPLLERETHASCKRLIFVLNKLDLIPSDVLKQWLTYLRREAPTVAFKSVETQARHVKQNPVDALKASDGLKRNASQVIGADCLIQLLKNYARGTPSQKLVVGIVGFPNVGKSSIINSLKGSVKAVASGGVGGITKDIQYVSLDKHIDLIDTPGVISVNPNQDTLLPCVTNVSNVQDPEALVDKLVQQADRFFLMDYFKVKEFEDTSGFLASVAFSRGFLMRRGVPNLKAAAKSVLHDWVAGKIRFFARPPRHFEDTKVLMEGCGDDVPDIRDLLDQHCEDVCMA